MATGLTPKHAARVIRFDRARRALHAGAVTGAEVAAHHGYADQSHFVREFRALAGCAPGQWLAEEGFLGSVANVQDNDDALRPGWDA